jgi:hypothetical protein
MNTLAMLDTYVALTAHCDPVLWHKRFGHLNMQSLHAQHANGVLTSLLMPSSVKHIYCDSCMLNKACVARRNTLACARPPRLLLNLSSEIWEPVRVPSTHGLRCCLFVTHHHTKFSWIGFLKSKDNTCSDMESILFEVWHMHARFQSASVAFTPVLKFDSDSNVRPHGCRCSFLSTLRSPHAWKGGTPLANDQG